MPRRPAAWATSPWRWARRNAFLLLLLVPAIIYLPAVIWFQLPSQFAVVMSGSMEPEYSAGDLVVLKRAGDIKVGDVIAFETPTTAQGYPPRLLHRVVEYDREGARLKTKGDANDDTDPFRVGVELVLGKATGFKVPHGGHIIMFLQSRYGKIWMGILALVFAYPTISRLVRWSRRSVRQAITDTMGIDTGRLERMEAGVNETQQALGQLSRAISDYATHLQSHTSAVQGMREGAQGLLEAVRTQNEILAQLKEALEQGLLPGSRHSRGTSSRPNGSSTNGDRSGRRSESE